MEYEMNPNGGNMKVLPSGLLLVLMKERSWVYEDLV